MPQMCPECSRDNLDGAAICAYCAQPLRNLLGSNTMLAGRYRVLRVLGCGGMGAVYLAQDIRISGRQVAIKENLDLSQQAQFQAEISVMTRLSHPGLPEISDQFLSPYGRQCLVMDFIPGDNLDAVVGKRGPLSEAEVLSLADRLLVVLEYLHGNGIIHRDIKPANIKLTASGDPVLVDFGIAKQWALGRITQTWARGFGSPGFASPEHYGGTTDERSDIYSIGAVLYFLVTTQIPPEAPHLAAGTPLPPPRQIQPGLSADMQRIIFKAMAPTAVQRYQTASLMRQAVVGSVPPIVPPVVSPPVTPPAGRNRTLLVLAGATIALLILVFGLNAMSRSSRPAASSTPIPVAMTAVVETPTRTSTPTHTLTLKPPSPIPTATRTPTPTRTKTPTSTRRPTATRRPTSTSTPRPVAEVGDAITVRLGPGSSYPSLSEARSGDRFIITARNRDCTWFQVAIAGGQTGWVPVSQVDANVTSCAPPAVADPPMPTATSPPPPTNTPVRPTPIPPSLANNVTQFSGEQGRSGWWYQVENGRNSGMFENFSEFRGYGSPARNCWQTGREEHVRICPEGEVHPGVTGRIAYRWRSDTSRNVSVAVHAHKIDTSCGDGVWIGVFRVPNGRPPEELGQFTISATEYRDRPANTRNYQTSLGAGDDVMVMVDIYRNSGCDQTRLYIDIK